MDTEHKPSRQHVVGSEIVALQGLLADLSDDLEAEEQPIAVAWGRRGGSGYAVLFWVGGAVVAASAGVAGLLSSRGQVSLGNVGLAIAFAVMAGLAILSTASSFGVLLTDRRLIVAHTVGQRCPRRQEESIRVPREDVQVKMGRGLGRSVVLTMTFPANPSPLTLRFDGTSVPSANALFLSLTTRDAEALGVPRGLAIRRGQ